MRPPSISRRALGAATAAFAAAFPSADSRPLRRRLRTLLVDVVAAVVAVALGTSVALLMSANDASAGLLLLLSVLGISVARGSFAGATASILASLSFNYHFLVPVGNMAVEEPESWVALLTFLVSAMVSGRLVLAASLRAEEAERRRRETEALYELSLELFAPTGRPDVEDAVTRALRSMGSPAGRLILEVAGTAEVHGHDSGELRLPIVVDGSSLGAVVLPGDDDRRPALLSVARLVELWLERERLLEHRARYEALRASDSLKTSLLRAVSHDLRTPLTALSLDVDALRSLLGETPSADAHLAGMGVEVHRLSRRIDNLLTMARLDAGVMSPRPEPTPAADLFRSARESLKSSLAALTVRVTVADDCPDVLVDPSLALEILVNLVENAARAAPAGSVLTLEARRHPDHPGRVLLEVRDQGPGLPADPASETRRGLGLEIAGGLAQASGGTVSLEAHAAGGAAAIVDLPAAGHPLLDIS